MPEIYQPAEDSYLLSEILKEKVPALLKQNPNLKFLEIGAGSGIHLQTASNLGIKKENIFSCDINLQAVNHCNVLGFNCIHSNLFEKIKDSFDLIIFNPPYLPDSKHDKKPDTSGGEKGSEIINEFLKQAKNHLKENGKIFLLTSSFTEDIDWRNYKKKQIGCERLFFETFCVWELSIS